MRTVLYTIVAMLCLLKITISAHANSAHWLEHSDACRELPSPKAADICQKAITSRQILADLRPRFIGNASGQVTEREVFFVAWDSLDNPHVVRAATPLFMPDVGPVKAVRSLTPNYQVAHVRGSYAFKLEVRVFWGQEELFVFAGKHLWIPKDYKGPRTLKDLNEHAETRTYLPFQDHLFDLELAKVGVRYVKGLIRTAEAELCAVPARTFPEKRLCEVHNDTMILALIASEQSAEVKVFGKAPGLTLSGYQYLMGVFIEIALHGDAAFRDVCSGAQACGWTQFTNTPVPTHNYPGTYNLVYRECRSEDGAPILMPEFERGTRDPINAIKAAICYLDYELAHLPKSAADLYLKDPRAGSLFMLTAFNAGGGWSRLIHRRTVRQGLPVSTLSYQGLPKPLFVGVKGFNHETYHYIVKYWMMWRLLTEGELKD